MKNKVPTKEDVVAQLARLYDGGQFRGAKSRRLLDFIVSEWLAGRSDRLTLHSIAETLKTEPLTFEEDSNRWGYPQTRGNLGTVRSRLRKYFETVGYRDQVIIKLNPGSYAPAIEYNPVSTSIPDVAPEVARLILRAKTALDLRTLRGARLALKHYLKIPLSRTNPRQVASTIFIPMAAASIVPSTARAIEPFVGELVTQIKKLGFEPWESIFAEACAHACYRHEWDRALKLFDLSITASQGEARYFWWYTALLASMGRIEEAMTILSDAVNHFSRTNIAVRTDLAMLQIMAGRFTEAEEHLTASLDFASSDNPLIAAHFALLYEAQDLLDDAGAPLAKLFRDGTQLGVHSPQLGEVAGEGDGYVFLNGLLALVAGRAGATQLASDVLEIILEYKAQRPANSSVEVALALIGLARFDEAVKWLHNAAFEEHDPLAMWFHNFPPLRHLRNNKPYRELLHRLHLPLP